MFTKKGILTIFALLVFMLLWNSCATAETWIAATIASYHTNRKVEHNERNWGIGIEHDIAKDLRFAAGVYDNSYDRQTEYLGVIWTPLRVEPAKFGLLLGGATGYDPGIQPIILPTFMLEGKRFGVNIGVMPSIDKRVLGILGLQLKMKF